MSRCTNCPQCGAELDSDGPAGLCPNCLIQGAFDSSLGTEKSLTQTIDTTKPATGDDDFGRYQIVRQIGEGGMGAVYLAEQREPIRRRVALKVVKLGMDTNQVLARFGHECQALAMMDHRLRMSKWLALIPAKIEIAEIVKRAAPCAAAVVKDEHQLEALARR